jgi:hypothetical protein
MIRLIVIRGKKLSKNFVTIPRSAQ